MDVIVPHGLKRIEIFVTRIPRTHEVECRYLNRNMATVENNYLTAEDMYNFLYTIKWAANFSICWYVSHFWSL
jgi:hypothetical protein